MKAINYWLTLNIFFWGGGSWDTLNFSKKSYSLAKTCDFLGGGRVKKITLYMWILGEHQLN